MYYIIPYIEFTDIKFHFVFIIIEGMEKEL